jgi:tRNA pseudouridine55 synthase
MFYLIDKPLGITSFDVIRKLRKILNTKKIGHTGTLDPLATGCLLIATEKSTKLIPEVENKEKRYRFSVCLEGYTDSLDLGSPIIPSDIT